MERSSPRLSKKKKSMLMKAEENLEPARHQTRHQHSSSSSRQAVAAVRMLSSASPFFPGPLRLLRAVFGGDSSHAQEAVVVRSRRRLAQKNWWRDVAIGQKSKCLFKVATPCVDDHQFLLRLGIDRRTFCSAQGVLTCLYFLRIG